LLDVILMNQVLDELLMLKNETLHLILLNIKKLSLFSLVTKLILRKK